MRAARTAVVFGDGRRAGHFSISFSITQVNTQSRRFSTDIGTFVHMSFHAASGALASIAERTRPNPTRRT